MKCIVCGSEDVSCFAYYPDKPSEAVLDARKNVIGITWGEMKMDSYCRDCYERVFHGKVECNSSASKAPVASD